MAIRFRCSNPDCQRKMKAPDGAEGKQARCPACGSVQAVPDGAAADSPPPADEDALVALADGQAVEPADDDVHPVPPRAVENPAPAAPDGGAPGRPTPKSKRGAGSPQLAIGIFRVAIPLVVLAALAGGIWYGVQSFRGYQDGEEDTPQRGYLDSMVHGLKAGQQVGSSQQLHNLYTTLKQYAATHGGSFPPSLEALAEQGLISDDALEAPDRPGREGQQYFYIAGQSETMNPRNVLVYEEQGAFEGTCLVLRVGGQIDEVDASQLQDAIDATQTRIE